MHTQCRNRNSPPPTNTHSMLTPPSTPPHLVHSHRRTLPVLRSKIRRLQSCPSFLHDLKLPVLSAPDMHTSAHTHTHTQPLTLLHKHTHTHACILTNLMEAITELSSSCWPAIKCFPPLLQFCTNPSKSFFSTRASAIATLTAPRSHPTTRTQTCNFLSLFFLFSKCCRLEVFNVAFLSPLSATSMCYTCVSVSIVAAPHCASTCGVIFSPSSIRRRADTFSNWHK